MQELPTEGRDSVKLRCQELLHILVVDDSSIIRQMVCKSLGLAGLPPHEISEASDGAQALSMLREGSRTFDLVLADIHMPKMTGTQLVGAMSEDERLKSIPPNSGAP